MAVVAKAVAALGVVGVGEECDCKGDGGGADGDVLGVSTSTPSHDGSDRLVALHRVSRASRSYATDCVVMLVPLGLVATEAGDGLRTVVVIVVVVAAEAGVAVTLVVIGPANHSDRLLGKLGPFAEKGRKLAARLPWSR